MHYCLVFTSMLLMIHFNVIVGLKFPEHKNPSQKSTLVFPEERQLFQYTYAKSFKRIHFPSSFTTVVNKKGTKHKKKCCDNLFDKFPIHHEAEVDKVKRPNYFKFFEYPSDRFPSGYGNIKPVTEVIEGDLKYDFRTKTHSY